MTSPGYWVATMFKSDSLQDLGMQTPAKTPINLISNQIVTVYYVTTTHMYTELHFFKYMRKKAVVVS